MKFADKYELSEALTTGRLETFVGRDVGSGAPVLVHIFDAPPKKADQPTVLWALESFRAVAPDPPGLVISAGRYGGTSYAYLVTQVPDDAALKRWTQAYESSMAETWEIPTERTRAPENAPSNASSRANAEPVAVPDAFSRQTNPPTGFFGLQPPVETNAKAPDGAVRLAGGTDEAAGSELGGITFGPRQSPPGEQPGEFTKQFFVGSNAPVHPVANQAPVPSVAVESVPATPGMRGVDRIETPDAKGGASPSPSLNPDGSLPEPGGFTALFRPSIKPETKDAPRIDAARNVDDAKAGDFTRFFQGPFDGERPAEIPDALPQVTSAPRGKVPGEFTQMFGSAKDSPFAASSSSANPVEDNPLQSDPGSFTRSFADAGHISYTSDPLSPAGETRVGDTKGNGSQKPPTLEPRRAEPVLSPLMPSAHAPDPPIIPTANVAAPRESRPSVQGGATQLFSVPGGHSAPTLPAPPTGPSEYTRIISGGMAGLASEEEQPVAVEGPAAGGLPTFKMPAPIVPAAPKIAAPPAPELPAPPKAPQLGALAPKPKASYLPMIIILNVSLIVAVLLIVYFAIKH
jgi:hypothetical protein